MPVDLSVLVALAKDKVYRTQKKPDKFKAAPPWPFAGLDEQRARVMGG
jgi:hypothetical protein